MPLDDYVYSFTIENDYAEDLLTRPCMEQKGFEWPVAWRNLDALQSESYNHIGLRLFDVELASSYGYHVAPNTDPSALERRKIVEQKAHISPEEDAALTSCLASVRKSLPTLPLSAQNGATFSNDALDRARVSDAVKSASSRWRNCMGPAGVADLPEEPDGMPTTRLSRDFGLVDGDGVEGLATAEEVRIASADASCRESSGYREALYGQEWEAQVDALREHGDELARVRAVLAKHREKVMDVIARTAPVQQ